MHFFELIKQGALALIPLGLCSVLVVAVVLERLVAFMHTGKVSRELMRRVENLLISGKREEAVYLLNVSDGPFARIAKASLEHPSSSQQETADILTLACDAEISAAAGPLPVLGTIGNIAPFIGLFGTVIGIMKAFETYRTGATGPEAISGAIGEALIATAVGLGVGIVAVVCNNWCSAWVEGYRLRLERFSTEWSYRLHELLPTANVSNETLAPAPTGNVEEPVA